MPPLPTREQLNQRAAQQGGGPGVLAEPSRWPGAVTRPPPRTPTTPSSAPSLKVIYRHLEPSQKGDPVKGAANSKPSAPLAATHGQASGEGFAEAAASTSSMQTRSSSGHSTASQGWSEEDKDGASVILIVDSKRHRGKMQQYCSWLHMFEHARWLHGGGIAEADIKWPYYPYQKTGDRSEQPYLERMHDYLASIAPKVRRPDPSLWSEIPHCESRDELNAAFKLGTIHFSGKLSSDPNKKLVFKLLPPSAGMGSSLYRRYGSDRFFRINLDDDVVRAAAQPLETHDFDKSPKLRAQIQTFFGKPLFIFGRTYRPFCWKDGAAVYWAESGPHLETIPLVEFAQRYLDVSLNEGMTVAKYAARFELGLTTTTPTVVFPRDRVLRTPDLNSDSLKMSVAAMQLICDVFRAKFAEQGVSELLPGSYLPSCIRGTVVHTTNEATANMVWQLDYSSPPGPSTEETSSEPWIQLRSSGADFPAVNRPGLKFQLEFKNGKKLEVRVPKGLTPEWIEGPAVRKDEVVMTDGCSLMSPAAMRILAEKLAASRRETDIKPNLPAVAQGRIGPGKGVWAIAPQTSWSGANDVWIEVRDSQYKFKDEQTRDFVFELHSVPNGNRASAKLGKQMFEVLSHCGVSTKAIEQIFAAQISTGQDAFRNFTSTPELLYHIEKTCGVLEDRTMKARMSSDPGALKLLANGVSIPPDADTADASAGDQESSSFVHDRRLDPSSGAPNVVTEVVVDMLQAGFDPRHNPHLAEKVRKVAEGQLDRISLKIDDEYARTAFVVADHFGVLSEGEFFFQTREPIPDPSGYGQRAVMVGPALLSRSPAIQPCDVQKVEGVWRSEYASTFDVIIVSTKGERSLCSILSGGDYDGDKLVVTINPAFVPSFRQANADPRFADPPFEDENYFEVDRRRLRDVKQIFDNGENDQLAAIFMEGLHAGTQYGVLSTYHTSMAYSHGLAHPLTSKLGHLFCRALDGRKQGLSFSPKKWDALKQELPSTCRIRPKWTYRDDGKPVPAGAKDPERSSRLKHPMDALVRVCDSARTETRQAWADWMKDQPFKFDEHLAEPWQAAWSAAASDREGPFYEDLVMIRNHVWMLLKEFRDLFTEWCRQKDLRASDARARETPGSPSKSPSKAKGEYRASSAGQKEDLIRLSQRFWSIVERDCCRFRSEKLRGPAGEIAARTLLASCAYVQPLRPSSLRLRAPGSATRSAPLEQSAPNGRTGGFISRLKGMNGVKTIVHTPSGSQTVQTITPPAEEGDDPMEVEKVSYTQDGGLAWSQVDDEQLEVTNTTPISSRKSSQTVASTELAPSAELASSSTLIAPSAEDVSDLCPRGLADEHFHEKTGTVPMRFCFDMAHRDVNALKADALARELHKHVPGAVGIQAPKIAPHILDVLQVSKRCAGINAVRAKVRPRTLLEQAETSAAVRNPNGSPVSKRPRRT